MLRASLHFVPKPLLPPFSFLLPMMRFQPVAAIRCACVIAAMSLTASASAQILPSYGEDRAGTSGFQFLEVPVDPRGAALGGTAVATARDASSLFWNPALASRGADTELQLSHLTYHAGVSMGYVAGIRRLGPVYLGAHIQTLNSGEMDVTDEFSGPAGTGETFSYLGVAAGLTVSQALTDLFSYGVTAKVVREGGADVNTTAGLLDLGVAYSIGQTGADIGVSIRNFGLNGTADGTLDRPTDDGGTVTVDEFEGVVPPTTFQLGIGYQALRALDGHDLTVAGQLTNPNDNAERLNIGAEYIWNETLSVRTGYAFGAEEASTPTFGFGVAVPGLAGSGSRLRADYGFVRLDRLGSTHRIGISASL